MRIREREVAKKLVARFEKAVIERPRTSSTMEGHSHDEHEQEYFEAKFELLTYIYKLGSK